MHVLGCACMCMCTCVCVCAHLQLKCVHIQESVCARVLDGMRLHLQECGFLQAMNVCVCVSAHECRCACEHVQHSLCACVQLSVCPRVQ